MVLNPKPTKTLRVSGLGSRFLVSSGFFQIITSGPCHVHIGLLGSGYHQV